MSPMRAGVGVAEPLHRGDALGGGRRRPVTASKRLAGGGDRLVDVGDRRLGDRADHLFGVGRDDLDAVASSPGRPTRRRCTACRGRSSASSLNVGPRPYPAWGGVDGVGRRATVPRPPDGQAGHVLGHRLHRRRGGGRRPRAPPIGDAPGDVGPLELAPSRDGRHDRPSIRMRWTAGSEHVVATTTHPAPSAAASRRHRSDVGSARPSVDHRRPTLAQLRDWRGWRRSTTQPR